MIQMGVSFGEQKGVSSGERPSLNYFGVNGNGRSLRQFVRGVERVWHRWLNRRSQRSRLNWNRMNDMLAVNPLPKPSIRVQIWSS